MAKKKQTPMMEQYWEYRSALPDDTLLLFRLGDFYEMFHQDAVEGSRLLGITLTKRQDYPMAGIPYHAAENYIGKLLKQGRKVAICDQVETPKPGKLVRRSLTRILTPGTTLEDNQIEDKSGQYLLAIEWRPNGLCAAWLDLSTGEFRIAFEADPRTLLPVLHALDAREILLPEGAFDRWSETQGSEALIEELRILCSETPVTEVASFHFDAQAGCRKAIETLGVLNLDGFGIEANHPGLGCAGALILYASESLCATPAHLRRIRLYRANQSLLVDPATLRNLEIFKTTGGKREGSLRQAIDHTVTAMGSRLLEHYLAQPLTDVDEIRRRQLCVADFVEENSLASRLQEKLSQVRDIPRILARLQNRIRNPREIGGIRETLRQLPLIASELDEVEGLSTLALRNRLADFSELRQWLDQAVAEELPGKLTDGGFIRDGYDEELDRLRGLNNDSKSYLEALEASEQQKTGIKKLRIRYNGAFGYFIEVTKANVHLVPEHYIRKQTMTNAERYYTEELKEKEREILHAEERSIAREESLFNEVVARVLEDADALRESAEALAELDVYLGWSQLARQWDYCRPEVVDSSVLSIEQGRHPVVEQMLRVDALGFSSTHGFVPNDCELQASGEQIALITGPNMAGKSTYIRQVALITLMAQIGCWVPARACTVGLVDRIFSRVGASDELARGNSTFMVEMNETANILNNATSKSLVILDEIGRGTSTYDGLSIAWAVIEHLHGQATLGPRTLFATHYHELTRLEQSLPRLANYSVSVKEWNDEIIFVRQVIRGAADRSYGIHVARLAGLPSSVVERARNILGELETEGNIVQHKLRGKQSGKRKKETDADAQMGLF